MDGNMTLSKPEFFRGIKQIGYKEDGHKLWNVFCAGQDDQEVLSFLHFVPDLAIDLARFKNWTHEKFNGVRAAFRAFDSDGNGKLSYKEFLRACEKFGMWQRLKDIVHTIFVMLDDGGSGFGRGEIEESELEFLDRWHCPGYLWAEPDFAAKRLFFNQLLHVNKENPLIAWRKALDKDGNMKVSYAEFYQSCSKLMRSGAMGSHASIGLVNRVYVTLDPFRSGYISLRRWDAETYTLLVNFTLWCRKHFAKVSDSVAAWEQKLGDGVSLCAFRDGVQDMDLPETDVRQLFAGLGLEGVAAKQGRISLDELLFLDKWDPDKMLKDELDWEKMVGSRFTSGSVSAKKTAGPVDAVKALPSAAIGPGNSADEDFGE
jgi:Ca2+-binding EF-hand superfamily protein